MKMIFSVYDSAAKFYSDPFFALTKGQALRDFVTACNDPKTYLNQHPGDYTLFYLGSFDEQTSVCTFEPTPISLGKAIEFMNDVKAKPELKLSQESVNSDPGFLDRIS